MNTTNDNTLTLEPARLIQAVVPDDGSDRKLILSLRREQGVTRVDSVSLRAVAALQQAKTKRGRLPEPALAKLLTAVVTEAQADSVFDYIYTTAQLNKPGGGMIWMKNLLGATTYVLPGGVPDEAE